MLLPMFSFIQKEIDKVENQMIGANKSKINFYEPILKGFKVKLSILKSRKSK
jgi:hypothetical protein